MNKFRAHSSSRSGATEFPRKLNCLFCFQSLTTARNRDHAANNPSSQDTLLSGLLIISKTLKFQASAPQENVAVKDVCCKKCFVSVENLVAFQDQINALEASKLEQVKLLQTLISLSEEGRQKVEVDTSSGGDCYGAFAQFRKEVFRTVETPIVLKIERETSTPPPERNEIVDDIFQQASDSGNNVDPEVEATPTPKKKALQPVIKLIRLNHRAANDSLYRLRNNGQNVDYGEDDDIDNTDDLSPPQSPIINYDDTVESSDSDESFQPEPEKTVKKLSSGKRRGRPPCKKLITDVNITVGVKPKRGRPKKPRPLKTERLDDEPPRQRGRPRGEGSTSGRFRRDDTRQKRRGRPSRVLIVDNTACDEEGPNLTGTADFETSTVTDKEEPQFQQDNSNNDEVSQVKPMKRKLKTASGASQQQSSIRKKKKGPTSRLKEDGGTAYKPIYAVPGAEGAFMFISVKFQITPTSFRCEHPDCSYDDTFVGHFTEQTAFQEMRLHIQHQHRGGSNQYKLKDSIKTVYFCYHCDAQLDSRADLTTHCDQQHAELPMPLVVCEVCGFTFPEKDLVDHIITHKSGDEKAAIEKIGATRLKKITRPLHFPCDQCLKFYTNPTELRLHREGHIPEEKRRQHICDHCGDVLLSAYILRNHIKLVHFNEELARPLECPYCNKKFLQNRKINYDDHVRSHTGEQPFQCEQCGKGFTSKMKFYLHERTHVYKPIPCQYCDRLYKTRDTMLNHHKKHHPEEYATRRRKGIPKPTLQELIGPSLMYPCEPCSHVYKFKSMLVTHLKNKHKMEFPRKEDYPNMWTWEDSYVKKRYGWTE